MTTIGEVFEVDGIVYRRPTSAFHRQPMVTIKEAFDCCWTYRRSREVCDPCWMRHGKVFDPGPMCDH